MRLNIVEVAEGKIQGVPAGNPCFTVFKGIPYAKPPVGPLRWRYPVPVQSWEGIKKADSFRGVAPQPIGGLGEFYQNEFYPVQEVMDEDCLYLNVWTPASSAEERLPVLFWIHGGSFFAGYGHEMEIDGEGFCKKGIVFVSVSYRLGPLGLLAHSELTRESPAGASGNYTLADIIMALQWCKRNIAAFGGDPEKITIAGQSSGACCVQALMMSEQAQGLFAQAILHSADTFGTRKCYDLACGEAIGARFLALSGAESIAELRSYPAEKLVDIASQLTAVYDGPLPVFMPIIDGHILKKDPSHCLFQGTYPDIPCLMGSTKDEFTSIYGHIDIPLKQLREFLEGPLLAEGAQAYLELGQVKTDEAAGRGIIQYVADSFAAGLLSWAGFNCRFGKKPVYLYRFDHTVPGEDSGFYGAFHSGDLWYVFQTLQRSQRPFNGQDYDLSEKMVSYWANFVRKGDPNGGDLPVWNPYTSAQPGRLLIKKFPEMELLNGQSGGEFLVDYLVGRVSEEVKSNT